MTNILLLLILLVLVLGPAAVWFIARIGAAVIFVLAAAALVLLFVVGLTAELVRTSGDWSFGALLNRSPGSEGLGLLLFILFFVALGSSPYVADGFRSLRAKISKTASSQKHP